MVSIRDTARGMRHALAELRTSEDLENLAADATEIAKTYRKDVMLMHLGRANPAARDKMAEVFERLKENAK